MSIFTRVGPRRRPSRSCSLTLARAAFHAVERLEQRQLLTGSPLPTPVPVAVAGDSAIDLSWPASVAPAYDVYRSTTSGQELTSGQGARVATGITSTHFIDTALTDGTPYYYQVIAVDPAGINGPSTPSGEVSATPMLTALVVNADGTTGKVSGPTNYPTFAGATIYTANQRSALTTLSVVFNQPVNFAAGAFTLNYELGVHLNFGNTAHQTDGASYVAASSPDHGLTWNFTLNLTGTNPLDRSGSSHAGLFANGIYQLQLNDALITSVIGAVPLAGGLAHQTVTFHTNDNGGSTYAFHALFGDTRGAGIVNGTDYGDFQRNCNQGPSKYNVLYDYTGHGSAIVLNPDFNAFKLTLNQGTCLYSAPAAPTGLTASAVSGSEIDLSWTNTSTNNTGLIIEQSTDQSTWSPVATPAAGATSYAVTGLPGPGTYSYRVRSTNYVADSANATLAVTTAPLSSLSATAVSNGEIGLSWTSAAPGLTGYNLTRSTSASGPFTLVNATPLSTGTTSYNNTGLTEGTPYYYQVIALQGNANGLTAVSAQTLPNAPSNPHALATGSNEVDLTWTNNSSASPRFFIMRCDDGSGTNYSVIATTAVGASSYADSSVRDGTAYSYRVAAAKGDLSGQSANSAAASVATPLAAASALAVTSNGPSELDLAWTGTSQTATGYNVYRSASASGPFLLLTSSALSSTAVSYSDTALTEATHYFYTVQAVAGSMTSALAAVDAYTSLPSPTLTATVSSQQVGLSWHTLSPATTGFTVMRSTDGGATFTPLATFSSATATSYADSTVTGNTSFVYEVIATNASGSVATASNTLGVGTGAANLSANELSSSEIDLSWTAAASDITGYNVYRSTSAAGPFTLLTSSALSPGATAYADTGLTEGTHYFYQVQATETSNPMGFQTIDAWTLPSAPTGLVATPAGTGEVDLAWTNPSVSSPRVFILRCDDGSGSNYAEIDLTAAGATSYQDTTVQDGTFYTYEVASASGDVGGQSGNTPYAVATTPVAAPSALAATSNGQDEIDLSWTNNSQAATGYAVYRSTDSAMTGAVKIGTVPYADSPVYSDVRGPVHEVNAGTRYYYTVTAMAPYGESTPSAIAHAVTDVSVSAAGLNNVVNEGSVYTLNRAIVIESGVADPIGSWVINWGDGNTATIAGDPGTFTHVYNSAGPFTVTATTADGAYSGTQKVQVNYAPGTLLVNGTPDGPANNGLIPNPTPHFAYSLNAAFTAPAGHHVNRWFINWGDGNAAQYPVSSPGLSGDSITFTHVYAYDSDYPMEYHPVIHAETDEDVYPWSPYGGYTLRGTVPYATWAGDPLWIGSTGPVAVDTAVGLSPIGPTYLGDSVTVDWGDPAPGAQGNTSTGVLSSDPSFTPDHPNHHYGTPGNYIVTTTDTSHSPSLISRQVILVLDQGAVVAPTAEQVIGAGQPLSLAVSYSGLGAAVPVGVVDWGDGTGPHTFDLSGGGGFAASLAHAPPPNLGSSLGYGVGYSASIKVCNTDIPGNPADPATAYFTLDAWGVVIGDGANTGVLVASPTGTQNLLPVLVDFPHPVGEAVNLTLNTTDKTENDLWTTASPNVDPAIRSVDTPVAFDSNNNYAFSPASDAGYQVFWVGATAGDTTYDVLGYGIAAAAVDTANCTAAFFTAEAGTPTVPPPQTLPATQPVLPVNKASDVQVSITLAPDPNNDPGATGSVGKPYSWLVGQMVNLTAHIIGPAKIITEYHTSWSVPGNTLASYNDTGATARAVSLNPEPGIVKLGAVGASETLSFFWTSTDYNPAQGAGPDQDVVRFWATAANSLISTSATLNFNLYSPTATANTVTASAINFFETAPTRKIGNNQSEYPAYVGLAPNPAIGQSPYGVSFGTAVSTTQPVGQPATFTSGNIKFVQLAQPLDMAIRNGKAVRASAFGLWGLDSVEPYPAGHDPATNALTGFDPLTGMWSTDDGTKWMNDSPNIKVGTNLETLDANNNPIAGLTKYGDILGRLGYVQYTANLAVQTYIMYRPPGQNSQWVPLLVNEWSMHFDVVPKNPLPLQIGNAIYLSNPWKLVNAQVTIPASFSRVTVEPEWSRITTANSATAQ